MSSKKAYNTYKRGIDRWPGGPLACPVCHLELLPRNFEKHFKDEHCFNPKLQCVWCQGEFTWSKNTKCKQGDHLKFCFHRFQSSSKRPSDLLLLDDDDDDETRPTLLDLSSLCEAMHFFGRERLADLPARAYLRVRETLFLPSSPCLFRDDRLNAAAHYVRLYRNRDPNSTFWCHAMVKAIAFESFLRAVDEARGEVTALPFSCWCDGGLYRQTRLRQHRHLILVADFEETTFRKDFWKKVKVDDRGGLPLRFPCKRLKKIESPLHLVNAMGYVSRRESRCKFSFKSKQRRTALNHFCIFRTLPKDYKLPLVLGWDGGVLEMLHWETLKNVSLDELAVAAEEGSLELIDGLYRRRIHHFFFPAGPLRRRLVLPVKKRFVPVASGTEAARHSLHLVGGRTLDFECDPRHEALGEEDWLRMQAERGNRFYDLVGDDLWTPRKNRQYALNTLVPVIEDDKKLKRELSDTITRLEACERRLRESDEERASQKNEIVGLRLRVSQYENDILSRENERLKAENEELKRAIEEFRHPNH